ncbi:MAG: copper chaperone PCu(A)C [Acidimicrobiales bacterium]
MRRDAAFLAACLVAGSCGSAASSGLAAHDGWSRPTPPITNVGAIYFTLTNDSGEGDTLVAARSDDCAEIEMHETMSTDGVTTMAARSEVAVGAGSSIVFEPNGLHLMCLGLAKPVVDGAEIMVELDFISGAVVELSVVGDDR